MKRVSRWVLIPIDKGGVPAIYYRHNEIRGRRQGQDYPRRQARHRQQERRQEHRRTAKHPASTRRGPGGQKPGEEGKNGEGITMTGMAIAMAATATKKAGLTVADENDVLRDGMYHKSDVEEMICPFADRNCEGQWCMAWKHAIDDWNFGYCGLVPRDD